MTRIDKYEYPEEAISKSLLNAIATSLFRSDYIESWLRGTIRIIEYKQAGIPESVFNCDSSDKTSARTAVRDLKLLVKKEIINQKEF